jgi:hypothetical protein
MQSCVIPTANAISLPAFRAHPQLWKVYVRTLPQLRSQRYARMAHQFRRCMTQNPTHCRSSGDRLREDVTYNILPPVGFGFPEGEPTRLPLWASPYPHISGLVVGETHASTLVRKEGGTDRAPHGRGWRCTYRHTPQWSGGPAMKIMKAARATAFTRRGYPPYIRTPLPPNHISMPIGVL